jgi:hypothetical protein
MIERQIDSPIPKPRGLVVEKASKTRSKISGARPGPESRTATTAPSDAALAVLISNRALDQGDQDFQGATAEAHGPVAVQQEASRRQQAERPEGDLGSVRGSRPHCPRGSIWLGL